MTASPVVTNELLPAAPAASLLQKVQQLAALRRNHTQHATEHQQRLMDFQLAHPAFFSAVAQEESALKIEKDQIAALESEVKSLTLATFQETQNKKPAPGCEVKLFTVLAYDEAQAFTWGKEKRIAILPEQLDAATFEAFVKAVPPAMLADAGLAFVQVNEEPRPQLAKDLDKALSIAEVTK